MTHTTIYHNPECGTSRNVLAALQASKLNPTVIEYLQTPPDAATLKELIAAASLSVRDAIRIKGTPYKELGLDQPHWSDDALIEQMVLHPILINRPLVVTGKGVRLCRPSDVVLDLIETPQGLRLAKQEGVPFLRDTLVSSDDPTPGHAWNAGAFPGAGASSHVQFYKYSSTDGLVMAHASVAIQDEHAIVQSLTVEPACRGQGVGHNVLALLLRRAFERGARLAWANNGASGGFFEKSGFRAVEQTMVPQAVVDASPLTDATADLHKRYSRKISL